MLWPRVVLMASLVLPTLASCLAKDSGRPVGDRCTGDGQCQSGLHCVCGRCRQPCTYDRDCGMGAVCVPSVDDPSMYVCTLPDEGSGNGCPDGLTADGEGTCRRPCDPTGPQPDAPCGPAQTCDQGWCHAPHNDGDAGVPGGGDSGMDGGGQDSGVVDGGDGGVNVDSGADGGSPTDGGGDGDGETEDVGVTPDGSADSGADGSGEGGVVGGAPTVPGTWVLIDVSGTPFTMGSPPTELGRDAEEVEHAVTLTRNFWIMTTEITQQQYLDVMGYNPSYFSVAGSGAYCGMDCPVEQVNWHEFAAYANGLSVLEGLGECYSCTGTAPATIDCTPNGSYTSPYDCPGYRLPTEAEWEYAARGGTTTATYNGELDVETGVSVILEPIAWYWENASSTTHQVGTKTANAYGLYDMLGNVREWCHDWYRAYPGGDETDPTGLPSGSLRVLRGGSWYNHATYARAANRFKYSPGSRATDIGARLVRSAP